MGGSFSDPPCRRSVSRLNAFSPASLTPLVRHVSFVAERPCQGRKDRLRDVRDSVCHTSLEPPALHDRHELGHYFFHSGIEEHVDMDFRVNWRRTADSPTAIDWREVTANRFAAEFLMPTQFMKSDLAAVRPLDKRAVTLFAVRCKISPEAVKIRLSNLGIVGPF